MCTLMYSNTSSNMSYCVIIAADRRGRRSPRAEASSNHKI